MAADRTQDKVLGQYNQSYTCPLPFNTREIPVPPWFGYYRDEHSAETYPLVGQPEHCRFSARSTLR
jgi:hypothetical protein